MEIMKTDEKLIRLEDSLLQRERAIAISAWADISSFIILVTGFMLICQQTLFSDDTAFFIPLLAVFLFSWLWFLAQLTHIKSIKRYRRILGEREK